MSARRAETTYPTRVLPHAREMDFTGRPMKGFVYVGCEGFESDRDLGRWIERGVRFAESLPAR